MPCVLATNLPGLGPPDRCLVAGGTWKSRLLLCGTRERSGTLDAALFLLLFLNLDTDSPAARFIHSLQKVAFTSLNDPDLAISGPHAAARKDSWNVGNVEAMIFLFCKGQRRDVPGIRADQPHSGKTD